MQPVCMLQLEMEGYWYISHSITKKKERGEYHTSIVTSIIDWGVDFTLMQYWKVVNPYQGWSTVASYPGLPMFFNVSHKKLGFLIFCVKYWKTWEGLGTRLGLHYNKTLSSLVHIMYSWCYLTFSLLFAISVSTKQVAGQTRKDRYFNLTIRSQ